MESALKEVQAASVFVVRASRAGSGSFIRNGAVNDVVEGFLVVDDPRHRIATMFAVA